VVRRRGVSARSLQRKGYKVRTAAGWSVTTRRVRRRRHRVCLLPNGFPANRDRLSRTWIRQPRV